MRRPQQFEKIFLIVLTSLLSNLVFSQVTMYFCIFPCVPKLLFGPIYMIIWQVNVIDFFCNFFTAEVSGLAQVFVHILDFPESNLWIWIGDASANLSNLSLALHYNKTKNGPPQNQKNGPSQTR